MKTPLLKGIRNLMPYSIILFVFVLACSDNDEPTTSTTDPTDPTSATTDPTSGATATTNPTSGTTTTDPTSGTTATTNPTVGTTTPTDPTTNPTSPASGTTATTDPTIGATTPTGSTTNPTDPTTNPTDPTSSPGDPVGTLSYEVVDFDNSNNITIRFIADFTDPGGEDLTYAWGGFTPDEEVGNTATSILLQNRFYGGITVTVTNESGNSTQVGLPGNGFSTDITNKLIFSSGTQFQTMEGIGAFGARDVWWGSNDPAHFHDQQFLDQIIDDLGITVHRDEYYPDGAGRFPQNTDDQDASWNQQLPFLQALKAKVDASGMTHGMGIEDFKWIVSLWTIPRQWKDNNSHKDGGTILPQYYDEFAEYCRWIVEDYANIIGVDLYGLSIQNEPRFALFYNTGVLLADQYPDVLKAVKAEYNANGISTHLFGPEDVTLTSEILNYLNQVLLDPDAADALTKFAIHGYTADGITNGGSVAEWELVYNSVQSGLGDNHTWMTESAGPEHNWIGGLQTALRMYEGFGHGQVSLWAWWGVHQPSGSNVEIIYHNYTPGHKYGAMKQYSRYVRPGAIRVLTKSLINNDDLLMVGFKHENYGQKTIIVINQSGFQDYDLELAGDVDPSEVYQIYRTSAGEICELIGAVNGGGIVTFPASSVTTLFYEQ